MDYTQNMNVPGYWRCRRTRRFLAVFLALTLILYIYVSKIANHESRLESQLDDDVPLVALDNVHPGGPTRRPEQSLWASLPEGSRDNSSCFHQTWVRFLTSLQEAHEITRDGLGASLTDMDKLHMKKMLTHLHTKGCHDYVEAGYIHRPTVTSVLPCYTSNTDVVTFVTQLGHNRFDRLELVLETWEGPVSAAVYVPMDDIPSFMQTLCACQSLQNRTNVDIHLVMQHGNFYPMNLLRNLALNSSKTPLSYLSDVDFIPQAGLVDSLESLWHANQSYFDTNVVIVPAFEALRELKEAPRDKSEVIKLLGKHAMIPARQTKWPRGHMPTNYPNWKQTNDLYKVGFSEDYEPYTVMKTSLVPLYSEHFVERFKDKVQQVLEVWAKGFTFNVLGSSFAIHYPHSRPKNSAADSLYRCALAMYSDFKTHFMQRYQLSKIPQFR